MQQKLKNPGGKASLKTLIITILRNKHLLSASQLLQTLENRGKQYNKTSVYRALEQLLDEEIICRHHFSLAEASYELREDHHTHLVCVSCDKISTSDCTYTHSSNIKDFVVNHHHLTLFGMCKNCHHKASPTPDT